MTQAYDLNVAKKIVIKIGSSLIVDSSTGARTTWLNSLADDVASLIGENKEVIIVSSGAIALGKSILNLKNEKLRLDQKQAAAAVGQIELGSLFRDAFAQTDIHCAQILLTSEDTEQPCRSLNARATIGSLLDFCTVPIVNQNDTFATAEIRNGDNDRLSARIARMCSADLLIIFSEMDGLFTGPPSDPDSQFISEVEKIGPAVEAIAEKLQSDRGTGGMATKVQAAKIATQAGTHVIITNGLDLNPVSRLRNGGRRTSFPTQDSPLSARKKWIASDLSPCGKIYIDEDAVAAIENNGSLLCVGVVHQEGEFKRGDILEIASEYDVVVARGISAYDRKEADLLMGHKAGEIEALLGYCGPENLVHCDDMIVFSTAEISNER